MGKLSLKELSYQVNELIYQAPVFGLHYYDKAHGDGDVHKAGQKSGRTMFYDFYAMELLHSWVGSGSDRKNFSSDPTIQQMPLSGKFLTAAQKRVIDDMYAQVAKAVSKRLIEYLKVACIMEFEYLTAYGHDWNHFRKALVSHYNANKSVTPEAFRALVKKYIPKCEDDLGFVKRLLKFSQELNKVQTSDYKDLYQASRGAVPKQDKFDPSTLPDEPQEPEATPAPMPGDSDPELAKAAAEVPPTDDTFADEPTSDAGGKSKYDNYDDTEDYFKKDKTKPKSKLNEELINSDRVKRVWQAMKKAGLTMKDIARGYNDISWGGSSFGGERWGAGAVAMLELYEKHKTEDPEFLRSVIDHIYDLQHNTGSMLNKGPMFVSESDLNRRYKITHIARFIPLCSSVIQKLIANYLHHFSKDPQLELQKPKLISRPAIKLDAEKEKAITDFGWTKQGDNSYRANIRYANKKGDQIHGTFYDFKAFQDGTFGFIDNYQSDIQIFKTWEEALDYFQRLKSQVIKGGSSYSAYTPTVSPVDQYVQARVKKKLTPDVESNLLQYYKMGWRTNGERYKAYFHGSKRLLMYAFTDGTFLVHFNDDEVNFKVFSGLTDLYKHLETATANALPYPEQSASDDAPAPQTQPKTTPPWQPSAPTKAPTAATSAGLPPHAQTKAEYSFNMAASGQTHSIRLTAEDEAIMVSAGFMPKIIMSKVWYQHSTCKDAVKFHPNNSATVLFTSKGKNAPSFKLKGIDNALNWLSANYKPGQSVSPIVAGAKSVQAPTAPVAPAPEKGTKAGTAFEGHINKAGFIYDESDGRYKDASTGVTIYIYKDRQSDLWMDGDGAPPTKHFKDLASLLSYLKGDYQVWKSSGDQKKTSLSDSFPIENFNYLVSLVDFKAPNLNITQVGKDTVLIHNGFNHKSEVKEPVVTIVYKGGKYTVVKAPSASNPGNANYGPFDFKGVQNLLLTNMEMWATEHTGTSDGPQQEPVNENDLTNGEKDWLNLWVHQHDLDQLVAESPKFGGWVLYDKSKHNFESKGMPLVSVNKDNGKYVLVRYHPGNPKIWGETANLANFNEVSSWFQSNWHKLKKTVVAKEPQSDLNYHQFGAVLEKFGFKYVGEHVSDDLYLFAKYERPNKAILFVDFVTHRSTHILGSQYSPKESFKEMEIFLVSAYGKEADGAMLHAKHTMELAGFKFGHSEKEDNGTTTEYYTHPNNHIKIKIMGDNTSKYILPMGPDLGVFKDPKQLDAYVSKIFGKQIKGDYSTSYYDDVGPSQDSYTIRLTKEDDRRLVKCGFKWIPTSESHQPGRYHHADSGYDLVFHNKPHITKNHAAVLRDKGQTIQIFTSIEDAVQGMEKWAGENSGTPDVEPYKTGGKVDTGGPSVSLSGRTLNEATKAGFYQVWGEAGVFYCHGKDFAIQFWPHMIRWVTHEGTKEVAHDKYYLTLFKSITPQMKSAELDQLFSDAADKLYNEKEKQKNTPAEPEDLTSKQLKSLGFIYKGQDPMAKNGYFYENDTLPQPEAIWVYPGTHYGATADWVKWENSNKVIMQDSKKFNDIDDALNFLKQKQGGVNEDHMVFGKLMENLIC